MIAFGLKIKGSIRHFARRVCAVCINIGGILQLAVQLEGKRRDVLNGKGSGYPSHVGMRVFREI